jgi:carbonic anhydrase
LPSSPPDRTPGIDDDLIESARRWESDFTYGGLPIRPSRRLAVLACMDARLPIFQILGLKPGEAHIVRNAGGIATEDSIRSLATSQTIGTHDVMVVHHTHCGIARLSDEELEALGITRDIDENVRITMRRVREELPKTGSLRGFVYEVRTGRLREIG